MGFEEYGPLRALLIIMCLIFVRLHTVMFLV